MPKADIPEFRDLIGKIVGRTAHYIIMDDYLEDDMRSVKTDIATLNVGGEKIEIAVDHGSTEDTVMIQIDDIGEFTYMSVAETKMLVAVLKTAIAECTGKN